MAMNRGRPALWIAWALPVALLVLAAMGLQPDGPPAARGRAVLDAGAGQDFKQADDPAADPSRSGAVGALRELGAFRVGENVVGLSPAVQVLAIIGGTLISEDLTCISVGTLIHHKKIPWLRAGIACFLGIYIGDLTFFFLGRLAGNRLLKLRFFSRALGEQRLREFGEWFDRKPWAAIMACRFLPGIRVPLYVSVGALTKRTKAFFWWTCFFAFVWTPGLIGLVVLMGGAITRPLEYVTGKGWWTIPLTIAAIYVVVRGVILLSTAEGRQKLKGWITRPFGGDRAAPPRPASGAEQREA